MGQPIHVGCPNIQTMKSRMSCLIYSPSLPEEECEGHMIPSIKHRPLVSIGKLCVAVYTDEFKTQEVTIKCKRKKSSRDQDTEEMYCGKYHSLKV